MTTLADIILERAHRGVPLMDSSIRKAAEAITNAQRFHVSDDVRAAIRNVVTTRPTTLIEALSYARPPFDQCWFEWDAHPEQRTINNRAQITPRRIGALLTRIAPEAWTMWTAWNYSIQEAAAHAAREYGEDVAQIVRLHDPGVGVSSLLIGVDLTRPMSAPSTVLGGGWTYLRGISGLTDEQLARDRDDRSNPIRWVLGDRRERAALETLDRRLAFRVRDYDLLKMSALQGEDGRKSAMADVEEEIAPMLSTLILMNSKNCVEVVKTEPPPKLNHARIKRGKSPLVGYSTVHINLSRTQHNSAVSRGMSAAEMRQHKVRGHFKVRKTGVFYWTDYERGNPDKGHVDHAYEVEP